MHSSLFGFTAYIQFVVYKIVPRENQPGKMDKLPCDYRTGKVVSAHNPEFWTDAATAEATAAAWGAGWGVGFVFTESDPFFFLDIDGCLVNGAYSPLALEVAAMFPAAAKEISGSGTGMHIFGRGTPPAHACKNTPLGLEFYHSGRFVALTGIGAMGDCMADCTAILPALVAAYFPPVESLGPGTDGDGPRADWNGPSDDVELLRRAMQSTSAANAFGNKASFGDLWTRNVAKLALAYPDPTREFGESEADAALAQHLAFWTGSDAERIERLMWQSALVRDKWTEHSSYLRELTIGRAVALQVEVLSDPRIELPAGVQIEGGVLHQSDARPNIAPYINPEAQRVLFAGCVFIRNQGRALVPDGTILKPEVFRVVYGGYVFQMDAGNEKTTRDAWEAFTQSQVLKCVTVEGTCFKPNLKPREIISRNGLLFINTFMPVDIARKVGDVTPFLTHLAKLLPDERDRSILLAYMAACVQHQGVKFQWAPLLQGVEGNGKTLFARCVEAAVGARYTHWPTAKKLGEKFNAWMVGKVFFAVEDIYVPDSKREILEDLKPMITGASIEIEAKGVDQVISDICGNFMFNSNHRDAIKKTDNDRRFCILFTAQQERADLARDGMGGDYFPNLYRWLNVEGYAIVADYLHTFAIADALNPATSCQRAPVTTSTKAAIESNSGYVEQEIQEAIARGDAGFAGDFISSYLLEKMLERLRVGRISASKRKQILESLGYMHHPALTGGRVNNIVLPDNTKPTLFVRKDSMLLQISSPAEVAKKYEAANNGRAFPFAQRA